jgi:hypothetical protein
MHSVNGGFVVTQEEIKALKPGDCFFDKSCDFLGTVTANENGSLYWTWQSLRTNMEPYSCDLPFHRIGTTWIRATPLIEALS